MKNRESTLSEYELMNKDDILSFIQEHPQLTGYINMITEIIENTYGNRKLSMEYTQDPEIETLNYICTYIHSDEESFDKDWEKLRNVNHEIHNLKIPLSIKNLLLIDLY